MFSQGVQRVLEVLCCPGSKYRHEATEDTAPPLSKKQTNKNPKTYSVNTECPGGLLSCKITALENKRKQNTGL